MIEIKNLSKKYKRSKNYSVKDITMTINDGEIFGLLGMNGAGKSTLIKCLTGVIPFSEGQITICGYDLQKQPIKAKLSIGYVPDNHAVYENLTGREYVGYMGSIYGVKKKEINERIERLAKAFSISEVLDRQIRSYSHGMKQKICVLAALIHNPRCWILDEPLLGLDPQSMAEIKSYMFKHKAQGNSVVFSSHNIDMVEKLCDRVAIIRGGHLVEVINVNEFQSAGESLEKHFFELTSKKKEQKG